MISNKWLAGFFDGEGCVRIYKQGGNYSSVVVSIGQKHRRVLDEVRNFLGFGTIGFMEFSRSGKVYSAFQYQCCDRLAEKFLKRVRPYVVNKSFQVEFALQFMKYKKRDGLRLSVEELRFRKVYWELLKLCKKKGY